MPQRRQPDKPKRPSMYDVARRAGVSQTTVSFVVNDVVNANIPQETRDRIWAAVEELGWRPNAMARSLSTRQSHTIGLISDEIVTSPHAGKIIQGAQETAWAHGKMLLVINTDLKPTIEQAALDMLLERQVEAVIYATMYHRQVVPSVDLTTVPTVLLNCYAPDHALTSVVPNEVQGGRTATEFLLSKGHRRIGFINNSDPIPASSGRLTGYTEALAAYDIRYDPALVRSGPSTAAEGYRCTMELLQLPQRPTALFCFSDPMAMGAYDAVKKLGLSIPDDIAIVGFDNHELIAAQLHPPLTTVALPHYEMGQWAAQYLMDHADSWSALPPTHHTMTCNLIERTST